MRMGVTAHLNPQFSALEPNKCKSFNKSPAGIDIWISLWDKSQRTLLLLSAIILTPEWKAAACVLPMCMLEWEIRVGVMLLRLLHRQQLTAKHLHNSSLSQTCANLTLIIKLSRLMRVSESQCVSGKKRVRVQTPKNSHLHLAQA